MSEQVSVYLDFDNTIVNGQSHEIFFGLFTLNAWMRLMKFLLSNYLAGVYIATFTQLLFLVYQNSWELNMKRYGEELGRHIRTDLWDYLKANFKFDDVTIVSQNLEIFINPANSFLPIKKVYSRKWLNLRPWERITQDLDGNDKASFIDGEKSTVQKVMVTDNPDDWVCKEVVDILIMVCTKDNFGSSLERVADVRFSDKK